MNRVKILIFIFLILVGLPVFAVDKVYTGKDIVLTGKIEGISDGIIHIKSRGSIMRVLREENSPVFKDSVEIKRRLIFGKKDKYYGHVIFADNRTVTMESEKIFINAPRYKVKNIEIYVQN